jgi:hypothetical protein
VGQAKWSSQGLPVATETARSRAAQVLPGELAGAIPTRGRGRDRRWARTMAAVGIHKRVSARSGRVTYQVWGGCWMTAPDGYYAG